MTIVSRKLIMIGLDGGTFDIIGPLCTRGDLPVFRRLIEQGTHATLNSTFPPSTIPAWNSIFTGVNPGKHGVTGFQIREKGSFSIPIRQKRQVSSLWQILNGQGFKQIVVNDPVTFPPETISGVMLSGFLVPAASKCVWPPAVYSELKEHNIQFIPELASDYEKLVRTDKSRAVKMVEEFAKSTFDTAVYLARSREWDVLCTVFTSTDRLQHFFFHDAETIRQHYRHLDAMIGEILSIEPDANVLILSDHGFGPLEKCLYVNTLLLQGGLVRRRSSPLYSVASSLGLTSVGLTSTFRRARIYGLISKITPKTIKQSIPEVNSVEMPIDFQRSVAFCKEAAGGIFLKEDSKGIKEKVIESLGPTGGADSPIERVEQRDNVIWGEFAARAPELFLVTRTGVEISPLMMPEALAAPTKFGDVRTGTHRPEGIFIACGPDVGKQTIHRPLHTWDVVPTVLQILGVDQCDYMDGKPVDGILTSDPSRRTLNPPAPQATVQESAYTEAEEEEIKSRLKDLGYI